MSLLCCILCSGFVFVNPGGFSRRHFEGDRSFAASFQGCLNRPALSVSFRVLLLVHTEAL